MSEGVAIHSFVLPPGGGKVKVEHVFYGETEEEAQAAMDAHAAGCKAFGPAVKDGETVEQIEDLEAGDWPTAEELVEELADDEPEEEGEEEEDEEEEPEK
jgi:hypothetical protein